MAGYITVHIQKSNQDSDWGFKMGSAEPLTNVVITQIDPNCVAAELLEAGDRIIEIEGMETTKLTPDELQFVLGNPSKRLSLVVLKKNTPKEIASRIIKTREQKVTEKEETKEEIEKRKEYEVVLEVSPRSSLDDALRCVKEKLDRGEKLDEKEMKMIANYNKKVQQSSTKYDSTRCTTQKGSARRGFIFGIPRNTEIQKRREKFLKEQLKEESITIQQLTSVKEVETLEEKKKKSSSFWTEPPSDLKKVIEKNQFWQKNRNNEPMTTSAIFSQLNDLHNIQRKTTAQEEKRQFWENCRKKYGWDPPESKYDLSHRSRLQDDITRSRSCEPEHLDANKTNKSKGFRDTNPFFSPSPTNPFYQECRAHSDEHLSRGQQRDIYTGKSVSTKEDVVTSRLETCKQPENIAADSIKSEENVQKGAISNEVNKEDFTSKCEFFERATSVPTSFIKNAQDIVSERLGNPQKTDLKKPSDFINEMKVGQNRGLDRSLSKEDSTIEQEKTAIEMPKQRSSSLTGSAQNLFKDETFVSELCQSSIEFQARQQIKSEESSVNTLLKQAEAHQEEQLLQEESKPHSSQLEQTIAEVGSFQKNIDFIEAEMNESIEKIKMESEKLRSLSSRDVDQSDVHTNLIPDTTAFPGVKAPLQSSIISGEFQKRSFVETSYEKVTKSGTPFENVEAAWRREFRVATPSGFYDNNVEEVFKQEAHTEALREARVVEFTASAEDFVDQSFREITRMEGEQPTYEYTAECRRQSNQLQNNSTDVPDPAPFGNGAPPPPPPPSAGSLPAVRIASEIGARKTCEPPAAIQNAMMTKDKKPFTYTPGGLNLNEIRSPRMARRISRNAHTEDSCSPQVQTQGPVSPPGPLPPAALAAMQPQIAIPVFPPGGVAPVPPPPPTQPNSGVPPPPPPPPAAGVPPPPPPPPSAGAPSSPPAPGPPPLPTVSPINISPRPHDFPRPEFLSDIASHPPLRPVGQPPRSSYEPSPPPPLQVQLKPVSPKPSPDPQSNQQLPFVPRPAVEIPQQNSGPMLHVQGTQVTPPIQAVTPPMAGRPVPATPPIQAVTPPMAGRPVPSTPPIQPVTPPLSGRIVPSSPSMTQSARAPPTPPIQQVRAPSTPPIGQRQAATPPTPPTPSLNKSPAPWLTTKPAQKESVPPWTVRQPSVEAPSPTPAQQPISQSGQLAVTRVIPIQIEGREPPPPPKAATTSPQPYYNQVLAPQQYAPTPPPQFQQSPQTLNNQQRYVQPPPNFPNYGPSPTQQQQYTPPQYQVYQQPNQQIYSQSQPPQTRIIPIQIEGADNGKAQPPYYSQNSCPTGNVQTRSQNGDAMDGRKFQTQSSYSGNPTQSRSFRVLQKITGSDDDAQERLDESEY